MRKLRAWGVCELRPGTKRLIIGLVLIAGPVILIASWCSGLAFEFDYSPPPTDHALAALHSEHLELLQKVRDALAASTADCVSVTTDEVRAYGPGSTYTAEPFRVQRSTHPQSVAGISWSELKRTQRRLFTMGASEVVFRREPKERHGREQDEYTVEFVVGPQSQFTLSKSIMFISATDIGDVVEPGAPAPREKVASTYYRRLPTEGWFIRGIH